MIYWSGFIVFLIAVFLAVAAIATAFLFFMESVWFFTTTIPARVEFVSALVPTILVGAVVGVFWKATYRGREPLTRSEPQKIEARLNAQRRGTKYHFSRWLYDRAPYLDGLDQIIKLLLPTSFWLAVVTSCISAVSKEAGVPNPVKGATMFCILLFAVTAVLWRFTSILEDLFGDIELYAVEDTLGRGGSSRRSAVRDEVGIALRRVVLARPLGRPYARVILVGHSLGSALAYDVLISQADRALAGDTEAADALRAIRALIVYGSPIELFQRYFDIRGTAERHRREGVGQKLFGSGIQVGSSAIAVRLLNVWAVEDPLSNPIGEAIAPRAKNLQVQCGCFPFAHVLYTSPSNHDFWQGVLDEINARAWK